ncbi:hypothetical protein ACIB24_13290 [Spongisporangium articulatum]|uniref:FtsX-like permease family protein n=1 Tax=Spongisporangium articulatum TaxID=3362603 RepID=A0ABW8ANU0_9ACTN
MTLVPALILARGRAAGLRHAVLIAALALGAALPVVLQAGALVTADAALGRALDDLPLADRSVTVSRAGLLTDAELAGVDAAVRRELTGLVDDATPLRSQVVYHRLGDTHGTDFVLAGTQDLRTAVRLTSGRPPRSCTPTRCEVLAVPADPAAPPSTDPHPDADSGLVVVGRAVRIDPLLLSGTFDPKATVLLADGVGPVSRVAPLELIQRTYGWVGPLDRDQFRRSGVAAWTAAEVAAADRLSPYGAALTAPDSAIAAAAARSDASTGRFGLLAGSCAVLLLGAALCGAAALRPDHVRFTAALRRRGLAATPLRLVTLGEVVLVCVAGSLAGLVLGAAVSAGTAGVAGPPVAGTVDGALSAALPTVGGLGLAALALISLVLWPAAARPAWTDERATWRLVSVVAAAAVAAVVLVVSRGSAGADDPLLVVLPSLVLLAAALLAARAWPWVGRGVYRLLPRRAVGLRLGVAGVSAHPLLAASTAALLVAGVGASGFAISYRATLQRGAADQAAFVVPLDVRLAAGASGASVLGAGSAAELTAAAGGRFARPVIRTAGSLRSGAQRSEVVQFVGLEPAALEEVRRWSATVGGGEAEAVARAVATSVPATGLALPAGRTLAVATDEDTVMDLSAVLRADDGRERSLPLSAVRGAKVPRQEAVLPSGAGWRLIALTYTPDNETETLREHGLAEDIRTRAALSGRIELGSVSVDGAPLTHPWAGWTGDGLSVRDGGEAVRLDYRLDGPVGTIAAARTVRLATAGTPVPVAADPVTARGAGGVGGRVTLTLNQEPVQARIAAVLPRFPTVDGGRFVVADLAALSTVLDQQSPGTAQPDELWVSGTGGASNAALLSGLSVQRAVGVERDLRTDPVAVGAVRLLLLAAGLTALVGLAALVLLVAGERDEDAGELYAWETEGVPPAVLRHSLWARAAAVTVLGVPVGVLGALVLTRLTARLVPLTAGAGQPRPPLAPVAGLGTATVALVGALALALTSAVLVAARSFREPSPVPPGTGR